VVFPSGRPPAFLLYPRSGRGGRPRFLYTGAQGFDVVGATVPVARCFDVDVEFDFD